MNKAPARHSLVSLLDGIELHSVVPDVAVSGICDDSRTIGAGQVFVAVRGSGFDGHDYLAEVIDRGCRCLVVEAGRAGEIDRRDDVVVVEVADSRKALGLMARNLCDRPDEGMTIVAVTGTNGKTTTSYLLESILAGAGFSTGVLGTVSWRWPGEKINARLTTPGPLEVYSLLARMRDAGVSHLVMEVSSHALEQDRIAGLKFDAALFTNLSRDHLDYHHDMEAYYRAKKKLFTDYLKEDGTAVVFRDDRDNKAGVRLARELAAAGINTVTCGYDADDDFRITSPVLDPVGSGFELVAPQGSTRISSRLTGDFNLANQALAAACSVCLGVGLDQVSRGIGALAAVPGRLERVENGHDHGFSVYVDYAHTPDAVNRVLISLRELGPRRLVAVFGCGGDRDQGKRALMGEEAARYADVVVVTSDNPRNENPEEIAAQVESGIRRVAGSGPGRLVRENLREIMRSGTRGYDILLSREDAIATVIANARVGDMIAICGKGHEDYQEAGGKRTWLDDRVVARRCLEKRWAAHIDAAGAGK